MKHLTDATAKVASCHHQLVAHAAQQGLEHHPGTGQRPATLQTPSGPTPPRP